MKKGMSKVLVKQDIIGSFLPLPRHLNSFDNLQQPSHASSEQFISVVLDSTLERRQSHLLL